MQEEGGTRRNGGARVVPRAQMLLTMRVPPPIHIPLALYKLNPPHLMHTHTHTVHNCTAHSS